MLELAVLGLLKEQAMHGYELKKHLDEQLGHFGRFAFGSLYPTLKRLEKTGAVEKAFPKGEASRRQNVYRITEKGEEMFQALIEESGPGVTESGRDVFMLRLAFARYMQPETRQRLLEGRRGYLQERLRKMRESMKKLREKMDAYTLQLMSYGVDEAEHDIRWLDDLLRAERGLTADQPVPSRPAEGRS